MFHLRLSLHPPPYLFLLFHPPSFFPRFLSWKSFFSFFFFFFLFHFIINIALLKLMELWFNINNVMYYLLQWVIIWHHRLCGAEAGFRCLDANMPTSSFAATFLDRKRCFSLPIASPMFPALLWRCAVMFCDGSLHSAQVLISFLFAFWFSWAESPSCVTTYNAFFSDCYYFVITKPIVISIIRFQS